MPTVRFVASGVIWLGWVAATRPTPDTGAVFKFRAFHRNVIIALMKSRYCRSTVFITAACTQYISSHFLGKNNIFTAWTLNLDDRNASYLESPCAESRGR